MIRRRSSFRASDRDICESSMTRNRPSASRTTWHPARRVLRVASDEEALASPRARGRTPEDVRQELGLLELLGDEGPQREEVPETDESCAGQRGEVLDLGHVLPEETGDTEDVDAAGAVVVHHPVEGPDRLRQELRRGDVELPHLDAAAHLPDFRHAYEIPVLHEREDPVVAVSARDLGPQGLGPGIEEAED